MTAYTLPLGTLITSEEAGLMSGSIMGQLFEAKTIPTPDGYLLMFKHESVRRWAEKRIAKLRAIKPRVDGECEVCGATEGLREFPDTDEMFCPVCTTKAEREEFRYSYLETALKQTITLYLQAFEGEDQVRELLNGAKTILHHIVLDHERAELYGEDN